jgi:hypothetical protein
MIVSSRYVSLLLFYSLPPFDEKKCRKSAEKAPKRLGSVAGPVIQATILGGRHMRTHITGLTDHTMQTKFQSQA